MTAHALADSPPSAVQAHTYPDDWRLVRLGEAFRFTKKPRNLRFDAYQAIPFIPMEYVPIGSPVFSNYQMKAADELTSGTYIESGDLLVAKITPSFENGKQGVIEGLPLPFGYATTEVIPLNEIPGVSDRHFLACYLLRTGVRSTLAAKMEGSTGRQRLSISTLANWEMMLPPLAEQRAIARILRAAQHAIAARRRQVTLERERKAALMQRLFTHGVRGEPTKQTRFGAIPASWEVIPLDRCAYVQTGVAKGRRLDGRQVVSLPYLRVANVQDGFLDLTEIKDIVLANDEIDRYRLQSGDVLLTEGGDFDKLGRGFIWHGQVADCVHQNHIFAVRPDASMLLSDFLAYLIQSDYGKAYFLSVAHRTTNLASINSTKLKALPTLIPTLAEQRAIANTLAACDTHIATLEREIALHDELFRALLEELMSGRLSALPLVERPDEAIAE